MPVAPPVDGNAVLMPLAGPASYTYAMGSVQKLGTRYFIGWGFRNAGASDVTEIDSITHDKSFELTLETPYSSYRAQKFE